MGHPSISKPYRDQGYDDRCGFALRLVSDWLMRRLGGMLTMLMSIYRIELYRFGQVLLVSGVSCIEMFKEFITVTQRHWSRLLVRKDPFGVATTCSGTMGNL